MSGNGSRELQSLHQEESTVSAPYEWGYGEENVPFTQEFDNAISATSNENAASRHKSPSFNTSNTSIFEKLLATLNYDEIRSLRRIKIDAINSAMLSGDKDALNKAQYEFEHCSKELRKRSGEFGLAISPGAQILAKDSNSIEADPAKADKNKAIGFETSATKTVAAEITSRNTSAIETITPETADIKTVAALIADTKTPTIETDDVRTTGVTMNSNRFGVSSLVWDSAQQNEFIKNTLLTFPFEAVEMYKTTPFEEKRLLLKQLQEKTKVMWVTVDHKEAFITGSAYGKNTFDFLSSQIDEDVKSGKIPKELGEKRLEAVGVFRQMTSEQRKAFVSLLEMEVGMAKI